jgi:putative flippase GtrA
MSKQSIRFIIVGILNTVIGFLVYYFCLKVLYINYLESLLISHIVGVLHSYIWNSKWTFNADKINISSLFKFSSVYALTFLINLIVLFIFVNFIGISKLIGQIFALFITTIISYVGHKFWSFKS